MTRISSQWLFTTTPMNIAANWMEIKSIIYNKKLQKTIQITDVEYFTCDPDPTPPPRCLVRVVFMHLGGPTHEYEDDIDDKLISYCYYCRHDP